MRPRAAVLMCFVTLMTVPAAGADEPADPRREAAKALVAAGNQAYDQGDYGGALADYKQAREKFASPMIYYSMGLALMKLGRTLEAIDAFEAFLDQAKNAPEDRLADARAQLVPLERLVGHLAVATPVNDASVMVDGKLRGTTPLAHPVRVPAGEHTIQITRRGYLDFVAKVSVGAGETSETNADLKVRPDEDAHDPGPERPWYTDVVGDLLVGGGTVGIGVGLAFFVMSKSDESDAPKASSSDRYTQLIDRAKSRRTISFVSMGIGGALIAGGIVRYALHERPRQPGTEVSAWLGSNLAGLVVTGGF